MASRQVIVSECFDHNMLLYRPFINLAPIEVFNYRYFHDIFLKTDWLSKYGIDLDIKCAECDTNPGCMNPDAPCPKCIVPIDEYRNYYINPRLILQEYHEMLTTIKDLQMTKEHCMQVYPDFEFFIGYPDDSIYGDGSNYSTTIQTEEVKQEPRLVGVKREKLDDNILEPKRCAFIVPPGSCTPIIWTPPNISSSVIPDGDPDVNTDDEEEENQETDQVKRLPTPPTKKRKLN